jgi:hypothetical protein
MKIKGWEKISGYTYKGYSIVNPIHNANETSYEATILNLNLPHKPKWELTVLTPQHKFKGYDDTFSIIVKDDENRSTINSVDKVRMASISIFRNTFEEMIDKLLDMRLTSVTNVTKNINGGTTGIINQVQSAGTNVLYGSGSISTTFTQSHIAQTIKDLQQQIDDYNKKL